MLFSIIEKNGTLEDCPIDGMKKVSIEEYTEYINLSDEEKCKIYNLSPMI